MAREARDDDTMDCEVQIHPHHVLDPCDEVMKFIVHRWWIYLKANVPLLIFSMFVRVRQEQIAISPETRACGSHEYVLYTVKYKLPLGVKHVRSHHVLFLLNSKLLLLAASPKISYLQVCFQFDIIPDILDDTAD